MQRRDRAQPPFLEVLESLLEFLAGVLYPGESVWIKYAYTVGDDKWGNWFQLAVRTPTEQLEVQLVFPAALDPVVWGTETSMTAEASPLRTPPVRSDDGELRRFTRITTTPALHARYRLE